MPGDEITIDKNALPVATLTGKPKPQRKSRVPGLGKGQSTLRLEDAEHLEGFAESMQ